MRVAPFIRTKSKKCIDYDHTLSGNCYATESGALFVSNISNYKIMVGNFLRVLTTLSQHSSHQLEEALTLAKSPCSKGYNMTVMLVYASAQITSAFPSRRFIPFWRLR